MDDLILVLTDIERLCALGDSRANAGDLKGATSAYSAATGLALSFLDDLRQEQVAA